MRIRAFAACVVVLAVMASGASSATAPFTDPAGDAGLAADVTNVVLTDDSHGGVQLALTATPLTPGDDVIVWIDADKNAGTGSSGGNEYLFEVYQDADGSRGWDAERWDGSAWKEVPDSKTETFSQSGNVSTWTFTQADIGGSTGFNFWVGSYHDDAGGNTVAHDLAPDGGVWSFVFTKSNGDVESPTAHAAAARGKAGKPTWLHYTVGDNSGKVAVVIVLFKGSRPFYTMTISGGIQPVDSGRWRTAYTFKSRGTYRFCVTAKDAAGHTNKASCAPVVVS